MNFWLLVSLVTIVAVVEIFADLALVEWANHQKFEKAHWGLAAGVAIYAVVGLLYGLSLLFGKISIANTLWQVLSIVIVFGIGVYMYKEVPTVGQWVGLAVILVGLVCMMTGEASTWKRPLVSTWHRPWSPFVSSRQAPVSSF